MHDQWQQAWHNLRKPQDRLSVKKRIHTGGAARKLTLPVTSSPTLKGSGLADCRGCLCCPSRPAPAEICASNVKTSFAHLSLTPQGLLPCTKTVYIRILLLATSSHPQHPVPFHAYTQLHVLQGYAWSRDATSRMAAAGHNRQAHRMWCTRPDQAPPAFCNPVSFLTLAWSPLRHSSWRAHAAGPYTGAHC